MGSELIAACGRHVYRVPISDEAQGLRIGPPEPLFELPDGHHFADVNHRGDRLLIVGSRDDARQIVVVLNWLDEVRARLDAN